MRDRRDPWIACRGRSLTSPPNQPRGHYLYPEAPGIPMVPYLTADEVRTGRGGKTVVSCLLPEQFHGETRGITASFHNSYPEDVRRRVVENWARYGFGAPGPRTG